MRITVIGGTGHIGTYLIPALVEAGHTVTSASRGKREPYHDHKTWKLVKTLEVDRKSAEKDGTFGKKIASSKPDAVIDLVCFTEESCRGLVGSLSGKVGHFLHCGSIWSRGHSTVVPAVESELKRPLCEYGKAKAKIEDYLLGEARTNGFPATVLHPGHISGPGWAPINPAGHVSLWVFEKLARGENLLLPNFGLETLHHVHASDVAQGFVSALNNWSSSVGESFNIVSPSAMTLRGYAEAVAGWFGKKADLSFAPFDEWKKAATSEEAEITLDHLIHSPNASIEKAKKKIDYNPKYTSLETVFESLNWLIDNGKLKV